MCLCPPRIAAAFRKLTSISLALIQWVSGADVWDTGAFSRASTTSANNNGSTSRDDLPYAYRIVVNETGLAEVVEYDNCTVTVVLFIAKWCPFSAAMIPAVLLLLADHPWLRVRFVDAYTDQPRNPDLVAAGFPTLFVYKGPDLLARMTGRHSYATVVAFLRSRLNKYVFVFCSIPRHSKSCTRTRFGL